MGINRREISGRWIIICGGRGSLKQSKRFRFKNIADLTRKELLQAGIQTSAVYHTGEGYYFIDYFPIDEEQDRMATHVIVQHIE